MCLLKNEDCVMNVGIVQSIVTKADTFSQFKESVNQVWLEDWYVNNQFISLKLLKDFINYLNYIKVVKY